MNARTVLEAELFEALRGLGGAALVDSLRQAMQEEVLGADPGSANHLLVVRLSDDQLRFLSERAATLRTDARALFPHATLPTLTPGQCAALLIDRWREEHGR